MPFRKCFLIVSLALFACLQNSHGAENNAETESDPKYQKVVFVGLFEGFHAFETDILHNSSLKGIYDSIEKKYAFADPSAVCIVDFNRRTPPVRIDLRKSDYIIDRPLVVVFQHYYIPF